MSAHYLTVLLYRLMGLFALFTAFEMLPWTLQTLTWTLPYAEEMNVSTLRTFLSFGVPVLLQLAAGTILIWKARALATWSGAVQTQAELGLTVADLHSTVVSAIGLFLMGTTVADLPPLFHTLMVLKSPYGDQLGPTQSREVAETWVRFSGIVLQFALGVVLLLNSSTLVQLLRRRLDRAEIRTGDGRCPHCGYLFEAGDYRADAPGYFCSNCKQELPRELVAPKSN